MDTSLLNNRSLYFFYQLCQIPHGSGNEAAVSTWINNWACSNGLKARQDAAWNVVIHKPASPGMETCRPLILQAHLDMVCDKVPDSSHDFTKDPILWNVEGDWIASASGTSLGADCGIGVAMILTALEAKDWQHPPLEVLLTTREETDFLGAYTIELSDITGTRMLNLDTSPDNRLLAGSCGGASADWFLPLQRTARSEPAVSYTLEISGLQGGHSGSDIDKGRGNAIVLLARALSMLREATPQLLLFSCTGGNADVAIPRDASALIAIPPEEEEAFKKACINLSATLEDEYKTAFPAFSICLSANVSPLSLLPFDHDSTERLLDACLLFPNGIQEMEPLLEGSVESSANLGILKTGEEEAQLISVFRAARSSTLEELIKKLSVLARILGGQTAIRNRYPSWPYQRDSALRETAASVFFKCTGQELTVKTTHAGNEVGIFSDRIKGLDAVSMGPTRVAFHSPQEKLSISSTLHFEIFFRKLLEEIALSEQGGPL